MPAFFFTPDPFACIRRFALIFRKKAKNKKKNRFSRLLYVCAHSSLIVIFQEPVYSSTFFCSSFFDASKNLLRIRLELIASESEIIQKNSPWNRTKRLSDLSAFKWEVFPCDLFLDFLRHNREIFVLFFVFISRAIFVLFSLKLFMKAKKFYYLFINFYHVAWFMRGISAYTTKVTSLKYAFD